ncbi:MAG TPA: GAF domain-containing protein [Rhodospirillaceae bacterium]|nr:GAF domain-containing protein [Rhodospirillaceae bacterium]
MQAFLVFIERFRLTTKLVIGFSIGIVLAIAIGINALSSLSDLEADMERMYEFDLMGISHIKEANINLIYMGRAMRQMMIAQDDLTRDRARAQVTAARETLRREMAEAQKNFYRAETQARSEQFNRDFAKMTENFEHAIALIDKEKSNPSEAARFITSADFINTVNAADDDLTALSKVKEQGSKATIDLARKQTENARRDALLIVIIGLLLCVGCGILIGASIKHPNDRLRNSVEDLAAGKVEAPIPHTDYPNEIGVLARAIGVLQGIYRQADEQHWVKSHAAEIAAQLQQAEDFTALAQAAVSALAPVIGAGHGAFYVADSEDNYVLLASYGYRERKSLSGSFRVGEGLVGQCVMEKAPILLTAPRDYIRIGSGLGDGPPASIIVQPIVHNDRVLGVLEMASFQNFTGRHQALLEALTQALATNMAILERNLRTRELLAATQEQAVRMEKQAAQLEEQQVEMEAQQAELLETENWFRSIIEMAPDGMLVADAGGKILLCNPSAEKLFGYETGEMVGRRLDQLLPQSSREVFRLDGLAGCELVGSCKDGHAITVAASANPLPSIGHRGKCVSVSLREAAT